MKQATVTVCMPAYNTARYVAQAVESVFAQEFQDWVLLVADNASDDGTWETLSRIQHPRMRLFRHPQNIGPVGNWNFLLKQVETEFFCFLGSDDLFYPRHLGRKIELLRETPEAPFAHGPATLLDPEGAVVSPAPSSRWQRFRANASRALQEWTAPPRRLASGAWRDDRATLLRQWVRFNSVCVTSAVFRKAAFDRRGLMFDPRLKFMIDWHLYLELMMDHPCVVRDDQTTVAYRVHSHSETGRNWHSLSWALEHCEHILFSLEEHPVSWTEAGFNVRMETGILAARLLRLAVEQRLRGRCEAARTAWETFHRHDGARRVAGLMDARLWPRLLKRRLRIG